MQIKKLRLQDFRSWQSGSFTFTDGVNIIAGENGAGKTNLLESIYLLSGCRSWRSVKRAELVRHGQQFARIEAGVYSRNRDFSMVLQLPATGKSSAVVNGVKIRHQYDLADKIRCVLFCPEDLFLVKGSAEKRRAFMDSALTQLRPRYAEVLQRYQKLILSKSRVLKLQPEQAPDLLPAYDAQLAQYGAMLIRYRDSFLAALGQAAGEMHAMLSGGREALSLQYRTVSTVTDPQDEGKTVEQLLQHLQSHRVAELAAGYCLSGVHRDDCEIFLCGRSARSFASQGQARSAALALKFGQRELFYRQSGEYPLLLLDDVLSELDESRQQFIARHAMGGQSIITCCQQPGQFEKANVISI